jgi:hypothetical protein
MRQKTLVAVGNSRRLPGQLKLTIIRSTLSAGASQPITAPGPILRGPVGGTTSGRPGAVLGSVAVLIDRCAAERAVRGIPTVLP